MRGASQHGAKLILALALALVAAPSASSPSHLAYAIPEARVVATEARQGIASDGIAIYAIDNSRIGKYAIKTGWRVASFEGSPGDFPHMNSCAVDGETLACAASNYPHVPHRGRVEIFRLGDLAHLRTVVLPDNPGSLTVIEKHAGKWWAVFANYDGKGGMPGRDHRETQFARLGPDLRVERSWHLPPDVLDRIAPKSISGAAWGPGGLLYASGHDKPEIYVLAVPDHGDVLRHVGTFATATFGQAIAFDPRDPDLLWTIDRATRSGIASRIPSLEVR